MTLANNTVYGGYVFLNANEMSYSKDWNFSGNQYFTKKGGAFRVDKDKTYAIKDWQSAFKLDTDSQWKHIKNFDLQPILSITERSQQPNSYNLPFSTNKAKT